MHAADDRYQDGSHAHEGYLAYDDTTPAKRPAVLIFHQWAGCGAFEQSKARMLAELGYVGFAVDMYGAGKRGSNPQENSALMTPLVQDRALLRRRTEAALARVRSLPMVDADRIGAIGFCFGGLCAFDLARYGIAGVRGCMGFHGLFAPPAAGSVARAARMHTKVLAAHGWNDPMVRPDAVEAFAKELSDHGADWQILALGGCGHAFTNPAAQDPAGGMQYSTLADERSFAAMRRFFAEVFGPRYESRVTNCPWPA
ncbi:MAG: dienelactone hydrolase family protein [Phycisphaerales bacterium]